MQNVKAATCSYNNNWTITESLIPRVCLLYFYKNFKTKYLNIEYVLFKYVKNNQLIHIFWVCLNSLRYKLITDLMIIKYILT